MKIITFRYNTESSAIIQENNLSTIQTWQHQKATNSILAGGYTDRFLWEEASSLRRHQDPPYIILGHWQ